jgi:hypothetical protein
MRIQGKGGVSGGGFCEQATKGGGCSVKSVHHVAVLLNQWRVDALPGEGYEPLAGYIKAIEFLVVANSPEAACEIAYGVTNSELDDLHCSEMYLDVVRTYREVGGFRSVTVDDMLEVEGIRFVCARFGFIRVTV